MKKIILIVMSLVTLATVSVVLSSCGDDEAPAVNAKLSFADSELEVDEGDGTIEIELVLDKAAGEDIVVEYDLDGSAVEGTSANADYEDEGNGEVEIPAGQTSAVIELTLNQDTRFENGETIEISIRDVSSASVDITDNDQVEIAINDDDVAALATFTVTTMTVSEDDGLLELEVKLDKAATENVTVEYTLTGTAIDSLTAWDQEIGSDYYIDGVAGEVNIASGATTAKIRLQLYTDFIIEDPANPETIIITITGGSGGVVAGTNDELTINLKQQDGRAIILDWDPEYDEVDMDLFYWIGNYGDDPEDMATLPGIFWSTSEATEGPELVFIPDNLPEILLEDTDASFGVSYTYWGGNESPMTFQVTFTDIVNGAVEGSGSRDNFEATYTSININEWTSETGTDPIIVQTFDKLSGNYTNVSQIAVPNEGSRVRTTAKLPSNVKRGKVQHAVLKSK